MWDPVLKCLPHRAVVGSSTHSVPVPLIPELCPLLASAPPSKEQKTPVCSLQRKLPSFPSSGPFLTPSLPRPQAPAFYHRKLIRLFPGAGSIRLGMLKPVAKIIKVDLLITVDHCLPALGCCTQLSVLHLYHSAGHIVMAE